MGISAQQTLAWCQERDLGTAISAWQDFNTPGRVRRFDVDAEAIPVQTAAHERAGRAVRPAGRNGPEPKVLATGAGCAGSGGPEPGPLALRGSTPRVDRFEVIREEGKRLERTLIILKPDAVQRRLLGRIIQRFEDKGLVVAGMKLMQISRELAERHYAPHKGKPFYPGLIDYITHGPVVVMVLQGERCIDVARTLMGATFGFKAAPGTIRGDFGASTTFNLVHGSDAPESAATEIALYFTDAELLDYAPAGSEWSWKPNEVAAEG